jgi:hypothetical protein
MKKLTPTQIKYRNKLREEAVKNVRVLLNLALDSDNDYSARSFAVALAALLDTPCESDNLF